LALENLLHRTWHFLPRNVQRRSGNEIRTAIFRGGHAQAQIELAQLDAIKKMCTLTCTPITQLQKNGNLRVADVCLKKVMVCSMRLHQGNNLKSQHSRIDRRLCLHIWVDCQ